MTVATRHIALVGIWSTRLFALAVMIVALSECAQAALYWKDSK